MRIELDEILKDLAQYIIYGEENIKNAYQKEKIKQKDDDISDINKIYKKFQQIEQKNYWMMDSDEIFYKQAKYLENFEYLCEYTLQYENSYEEYRVNNTYSGFSLTDFRRYFSWRTKVRKRKV